MFDTTKAFGSFAVTDTEQARAFYGGTLGLAVGPVQGMEEHGRSASTSGRDGASSSTPNRTTNPRASPC